MMMRSTTATATTASEEDNDDDENAVREEEESHHVHVHRAKNLLTVAAAAAEEEVEEEEEGGGLGRVVTEDDVDDDEKKDDVGDDDTDDDDKDADAVGSAPAITIPPPESPSGILPTSRSSVAEGFSNDGEDGIIETTAVAVAAPAAPADDDNDTHQITMELNVAYEALESMRITNLQIELGGREISVEEQHRCVECLKIKQTQQEMEDQKQQQHQKQTSAAASDSTSSTTSPFRSRTSSLFSSRQLTTSSTATSSSATNTAGSASSSSSFSQRWSKLTSSGRTSKNTTVDDDACSNEKKTPEEHEEDEAEVSTTKAALSASSSTSASPQASGDPPCLACGNPVCWKFHSNKDIRKNNHPSIAICHNGKCDVLFSPTVTAQALLLLSNSPSSSSSLTTTSHQASSSTAPASASAPTPMITTNDILEVYDRALLVLQYSCQFIPQICLALEEMEKRHDRVSVGSSATGLLSGVVGVAAAATIFTPVGPPLLLASILFGTSGAAVAAGSEAVNYRSDPTQMASRILIWYALLNSIIQLPATIDSMGEIAENGTGVQVNQSSAPSSASSSRRLNWTRVAMNAVKPLTVGAMSAISVYTESRELSKNIQKINSGHPCEKADQLRQIYTEIHGDDDDDDHHDVNNNNNNGGTSRSGGGTMMIPTAIIAKQLEMALKRRTNTIP